MKTISKLTIVLAMLPAFAACDRTGGGGDDGEANAAAGNAAGANSASPSNATGGKDPAMANGTDAAAGPSQVTREFLIGRWTDNGDCNNTITFAADGTFTVPGGGSGLWVLDGERLTFQGGQGSRTARVQAPTPDTIMLIQADGSIGRSTRCR
jgi:hypothetical protein